MPTSPRAYHILQRVQRGGKLGPVVQSLLIMNVIWFLYMTTAGVSLYNPDPMMLVRFGALYGPLVYAGESWRLLSCMFVHIGILHIGFNMFVLYMIGRDLEVLYGHLAFLWIYLFSGLCGAFASLFFHPYSLTAGASGAIFGVAGAAISFYLRLRQPVLKNVFLRWRNSLLAFIAYNIVFGLLIPGIDIFAHFGGLIAGFAMGFVVAAPEGTQSENQIRLLAGVVLGAALLYGLAIWLGVPMKLTVRPT